MLRIQRQRAAMRKEIQRAKKEVRRRLYAWLTHASTAGKKSFDLPHKHFAPYVQRFGAAMVTSWLSETVKHKYTIVHLSSGSSQGFNGWRVVRLG